MQRLLTTFRQEPSPISRPHSWGGIFVLSVKLVLLLLALGATARAQGSAAYEDWIGVYRRSPLQAPGFQTELPLPKPSTGTALPEETTRPNANDRPVLVITAIEGDDLKPDEAILKAVERDYRVTRYGCFVSNGAGIGSFYISPGRFAPNGVIKMMPKEDFERLKTFIANLPDDYSLLPPLGGRRLVLQVQTDNQVRARVYDRANMPDEVLEILRLSECRISSWTLKFEAKSTLNTGGKFQTTGSIIASPDGNQIIMAQDGGPVGSVSFFDSNSDAVVKSIPYSWMPAVPMLKPPTTPIPTRTPATPMRMVFSPDGSIVLVQDYGDIDVRDARDWRGIRFLREDGKLPRLSHPQFTSDGLYLLVASEAPALLVFDTRSWEPHAPPPEVPSDAVAYFPSRNGKRAVYVSKSGDIRLWDQNRRRDIGQLDPGGRILDLAFSPDQSLVAATIMRVEIQGNFQTIRGYRFGVWETDNGRLRGEPRAFELSADWGYPEHGVVYDLQWWPDGHYLLGSMATGIGMWNVESWRFRGTFSGCGSGFVVLPRQQELAGRCGNGSIMVWDMTGAIRAIQQELSTSGN